MDSFYNGVNLSSCKLGDISWTIGRYFAELEQQKILFHLTDIQRAVEFHKSKKAEDISSYKGSAPEWFINGVNAALLEPTALNKQAFFIKGEGNEVSMSCDNGIFTGADLGLGKYHFEIGAGKDNFEWV